MIKKFLLLLLPFLFVFGFVRTAFGNEKFLLEWHEVLGEVEKAPNIPQLIEENITRINDALKAFKKKESITTKLWTWGTEDFMSKPTNVWEEVLNGMKYIFLGISTLFTAIVDFFQYISEIMWLMGSIIYLVIDVIAIPFRYIIWVFNSYVLNPGT